MDTAVALVQAYLQINGYFTVAEYPVLEAQRVGGFRTATDIDLLAFRFPSAERLIPAEGRGARAEIRIEVDPELHCPHEHADMIVGEVKEGSARLNGAARDPNVLRVTLTRFGCCLPTEVDAVVQRLLHSGRATTPCGHSIRMVVFGSRGEALPGRDVQVITLGHVIHFLREYLHRHWDSLHHAEFKDPVLGLLAMMEKAGA